MAQPAVELGLRPSCVRPAKDLPADQMSVVQAWRISLFGIHQTQEDRTGVRCAH